MPLPGKERNAHPARKGQTGQDPCKKIWTISDVETNQKKEAFVSAEKMRILIATTAKLQRECKDPSVLLWIRSENAILFASETIEKQKL